MSVKGDDSRVSTTSLVNETVEEEKFSSRAAFIFCAIGSAVGLGNVWRFPQLVYQYGGGAFFIPYLLALFFIGIPVLCTEFLLGQVWGAGPPATMRRFHRRSVGVGLAMMFAGTIVVTYYSAIICWIEIYFISSFWNPQPWQVQQEDRNQCEAIHTMAECVAPCEWDTANANCIVSLLSKANEFFGKVSNSGDLYNPRVFAWWLLCGMIFMWLSVFLLLGFGAKVLGYIMYATMGLPAVFIVGLLILGLVLDTENLGPLNYVGKFDVNLLSEQPQVWNEAGAQICFSTSVSTGVMITFASYNQRKTNPCGQDSVIVAISNSVFSFLAGFAVYGIAGFLATDSGIEFSSLKLGGPSLLFQSYPVGVSTLGYPWAQIINVLFFLTLFLLGLDSAVSLAEPLINTIQESKFGEKLQHKLGHKNARLAVVGSLCAAFFILDLIYCVDFSSTLLDEVDVPLNNFCLLFLTFCTCFLVGWVWERRVAFETIGEEAHVFFAVVWNGGCFVFAVLGFSIPAQTVNGEVVVETASFAGGLAGVLFVLLGAIVAYFLCNNTDSNGNVLNCKDKMYYLWWGNIEKSRHIFNDVVAHGWRWWSLARLTYMWSACVKYLTPGCVLILFAGAITDPKKYIKFDNVYPGTDIPPIYTAIGMLATFLLVFGSIIFGIVAPNTLSKVLPFFYDEYHEKVPTTYNWKTRVAEILRAEGINVDSSEFNDAFEKDSSASVSSGK